MLEDIQIKKNRYLLTLNSWFIVIRFKLRQEGMRWLHTRLKKPIAYTLVYSGIVLQMVGALTYGLKLILFGRRVYNVPRATVIIQSICHQHGIMTTEFQALLYHDPNRPVRVFGRRVLILKMPTIVDKKVIEKGAMLFKFSETFIPTYHTLNVNLFAKYFRIILEPSSSGYSTEEILVWTTLNTEKVVILSPYDGDFEFLSELKTNLVPLKLGAADWVNPEIFYKLDDVPKKYDAIYVANFNPVKRVERYIRAVVNITRQKSNYHAALVCAGLGSTEREIMAIINWARTKSNISFFNTMAQSELNKLLNQSKVNMLLSLREGANKGLSEGLFSGTPALLLSENIGVNRASINDLTGKIVPDAELEDTLIWFSDHYDEFKPHDWANEYLSPTASTKSLAESLAEIDAADGLSWSRDLYPKVNQPELAYLNPENDWLLSKREELLTKFFKGADEKDAITFLEELQQSAI